MKDKILTSRAKAMRHEPTPAEQKLWFALRAKRFGSVKFRRQKVIGCYIVDFAARDPMLVIEIDGDTHAGQQTYDEERTRFLEDEGYRVIRFTNAEVMRNLEGVSAIIQSHLVTSPLPSAADAAPSLSPAGERAL